LNYEPNPIRWEPGTLVLHDADAKEYRMLLEVTAITGPHTCRVRYVNIPPRELSKECRGEFLSRICNLHDPARWGIEQRKEAEAAQCP